MKGFGSKDPCDIFLYGFLAFESKSMSDRAHGLGHFDFPFFFLERTGPYLFCSGGIKDNERDLGALSK